MRSNRCGHGFFSTQEFLVAARARLYDLGLGMKSASATAFFVSAFFRVSAVVVIMTRFEHWISRFAKQLSVKPTRVHKNGLANLIESLNKVLSDGFFEELAELRHSVVHADSRAEWDYKGERRRVADCTGMLVVTLT
jgi:hypothetical protein